MTGRQINWEEVAGAAGIALAVVVLALALPMIRDRLAGHSNPEGA